MEQRVSVGLSTLAWYWDYSCSMSVIRDELAAQRKGPSGVEEKPRVQLSLGGTYS